MQCRQRCAYMVNNVNIANIKYTIPLRDIPNYESKITINSEGNIQTRLKIFSFRPTWPTLTITAGVRPIEYFVAENKIHSIGRKQDKQYRTTRVAVINCDRS